MARPAVALATVYELLQAHPEGLTRRQVEQALGMEGKAAGNALDRLKHRRLVRCQLMGGMNPALWIPLGPQNVLKEEEREALERPFLPSGVWPEHARFDAPGMIVKTRMVPVGRGK